MNKGYSRRFEDPGTYPVLQSVIGLLASLRHTFLLLVLFSRFSERRPPGQYRKDEHGQ